MVEIHRVLLPVRFAWKAVSHLKHSESVWGRVEMMIRLVILLGIPGSAGIGFTQDAWRWMLLYGPSIGIIILLLWEGSRLLYRLDQTNPSLRVEEGKEEATGTVKRGWGLIVWNDGEEEAQGVHANLEHIAFCDMESTLRAYWPTNRDLHWAVQERNGSISIPGGQSARLQVIFYNESSRQVEFSYHGVTDLFRLENALSNPEPIFILLNITSQGKAPTFVVCRIHPDSARSQITHGLSENPPLELLYSGTKRPQLDDFRGHAH